MAGLRDGGAGSSWRDDDDGCSTDSGYVGTGGRPSPVVYGARAWGGANPLGGLDATPEPLEADPRPAPGASLVSQAFMGLMRSDVTCCTCCHVSSTFQSFTDLSLDLHLPRPPRRAPGRGAPAGGAAGPDAALFAGGPCDGRATPSPTPPPSDYMVAPSGLSGLASGVVSGVAAAGPGGEDEEAPLSCAPTTAASSEGSQEGGTALSQTLRRAPCGQAAAGDGAGARQPGAGSPEPRSGSGGGGVGGGGGVANGHGSDSDGAPSELGGAAPSQSSQQQRRSAAGPGPPAAADAASPERRAGRASGGSAAARPALGGAEPAAADPTGSAGARGRHPLPPHVQAAAPAGGAGAAGGQAAALGAVARRPAHSVQRPNVAVWGTADGVQQEGPQEGRPDQRAAALAPAAPPAQAGEEQPQQQPQQQRHAAAGPRGHQSGQGDSLAAADDAGEVSSPARPPRPGAAPAQGADSPGLAPPQASPPPLLPQGAPGPLLGAPRPQAQGPGKGKGRGRGAQQSRVTRCGECHTCRNKHLKKACERNK
ncbi:hypothetical protein MNEG_16706, partial [Monoraphidium neglectum]